MAKTYLGVRQRNKIKIESTYQRRRHKGKAFWRLSKESVEKQNQQTKVQELTKLETDFALIRERELLLYPRHYALHACTHRNVDLLHARVVYVP